MRVARSQVFVLGLKALRVSPLAPFHLPAHWERSAPMFSLKFIIQVSKGLIRDQRTRRTLMFYGVLIAMLILFAGATFLEGWLRQHILLFIIYWGICAWFTVLSLGLALLDMLLIRSAAKRERKRLEAEYLRDHPHPLNEEDP
jgi:pilus assembly protein TadC